MSAEERLQLIQQVTGFEFDAEGDVIPVLDISKVHLVRVLTLLKSHRDLDYQLFSDLVVVDRVENDRRFELNYLVMHIPSYHRIDVRVHLEEDESVDSVTSVYPAAHWHECEVWEFFGIPFTGNHRVHHLILQDGYDEFPLRKDARQG